MREINFDFGQTKGKIKPMHGIGQPPLDGLDDDLFHYLGEAGIPFSRLHDVGGNFGGNMPEGFDPSQMPGMGGNMPEGFDPSQMPSDFGDSMPEGFENMFPGQSSGNSQSNRPSMGDMSGMGSMGSTASRGNTQVKWLVASVLILGLGLIIDKLYKY